MKRILTGLLAAMMLLSLAACGSGSNNGSQTAPGQDTAGNATTGTNGNNSINNGADNNGTNGLLPDDQNGGGTNDTLGDDLFGNNENSSAANGSASDNNRTMGTSYDQMMRNARVHDTNGDLSDLENAYTPGALGW